MRVIVNGVERDIREGSTLAGLIAQLTLSPERLAVEVNQEVVRRVDWESLVISEGDRVEIVHFVGGG